MSPHYCASAFSDRQPIMTKIGQPPAEKTPFFNGFLAWMNIYTSHVSVCLEIFTKNGQIVFKIMYCIGHQIQSLISWARCSPFEDFSTIFLMQRDYLGHTWPAYIQTKSEEMIHSRSELTGARAFNRDWVISFDAHHLALSAPKWGFFYAFFHASRLLVTLLTRIHRNYH